MRAGVGWILTKQSFRHRKVKKVSIPKAPPQPVLCSKAPSEVLPPSLLNARECMPLEWPVACGVCPADMRESPFSQRKKGGEH